MSDPHQPDQQAGKEGSGHDQAVPQSQGEAGEGAAQQVPSTEAQQDGERPAGSDETEAQQDGERPAGSDETEAQQSEERSAGSDKTEAQQAEGQQAEEPQAEGAEGQRTEADTTEVAGASTAQRKGRRQGLLIGIGGGALVGLIVVLALGAFVWPGFLAGPGKPDATASAATAALASKKADELEKVSCHGPDGRSTAQIPPQAMQMIQSAKPAGPTQLLLDTEAVAPVDLTLSAQGQTQNVPAEVVLGVTKGEWCLKGISQRQ